MNNKPLLTIAIPTYNRCEYLEKLLLSIISQIEPYRNRIEVIICDNASTDNTESMVRQLLTENSNFNYHRNFNNLGMDGNFEKCYELSNGNFFWMIGDDDYILPSGISNVVKVLEKNAQLDLIYVNSTVTENSSLPQRGVEFFDSKEKLISQIGIMITFISAIICRKTDEIFKSHKNISPTINGMYLMQLSWQFPALNNGNSFAIINDYVIKATADNSGGYRLFTVFAENLTKIMDMYFPRDSFFSRKVRSSSMLFLINFVGRPEKLKNHNTELSLSVYDSYFDDMVMYKYVVKHIYRHYFLAKVYCEIKESIKKTIHCLRK